MIFFHGTFTSADGVRFGGDLELKSPFKKNLKIDNALVDSGGVVRSSEIRQFNYRLFGGSVQVERGEFHEKVMGKGKNKQTQVELVLYENMFNLRVIQGLRIKKMYIEKLKDRDRYELKVYNEDLPIDKEFKFTGFDVRIKDLQFREKETKVAGKMLKQHTLDILGNIDFGIPTVGAKEGVFRIDEKGKESASDFLIDVNQSWLKLYGVVEYKDKAFTGLGVVNSANVSTTKVDILLRQGRYKLPISEGVIIPAGMAMIDNIQGEVKQRGNILVVEFRGEQTTYTPKSGSGGRNAYDTNERLQRRFRSLDYAIGRLKGPGPLSFGGRDGLNPTAALKAQLKDKLSSGIQSPAVMQAMVRVKAMASYVDMIKKPNAKVIMKGATQGLMQAGKDLGMKAANSIIEGLDMPKLPGCKSTTDIEQLKFEMVCGAIINRGGFQGGAKGNMLVSGKANIWGAGLYITATIPVGPILVPVWVGVAVGHGMDKGFAYHGTAGDVPPTINGSLMYVGMGVGVTVGVAFVRVTGETWVHVGQPAVGGFRNNLEVTIDFAVVIVSFLTYMELSGGEGGVGRDDMYMAGTVGASACVKIAKFFKFCYNVSFTMSVGNKPAYIANGFKQQTTVKLDTAAVLNEVAGDTLGELGDYAKKQVSPLADKARGLVAKLPPLKIDTNMFRRGWIYPDGDASSTTASGAIDINLKLPDLGAGNFGGWAKKEQSGNALDDVPIKGVADSVSDLPSAIVITGRLKFQNEWDEMGVSQQELDAMTLRIMLDDVSLGYADVFAEDKYTAKWELRLGANQLNDLTPDKILRIRRKEVRLVLTDGKKEIKLVGK